MTTRKRAIIPTADSKTSMFPGDRNSFGLLPGPMMCGGTCPCATAGSGGCLDIPYGRATPRCYVFKTMAFRPAVHGVLLHNTELLTSASYDEQVELLKNEFARYRKSWNRYFEYTGASGVGLCWYRLHWAGDCFSSTYARALREAMLATDSDKPQEERLHFWGYSRSLFSIPAMTGISNCRWLVSLDDMNADSALPYLRRFHPEVLAGTGNVSVAYMSHEMPNIIPATAAKRMTACPADTGNIPHQGACSRCGKCLEGNPVWFKLK